MKKRSQARSSEKYQKIFKKLFKFQALRCIQKGSFQTLKTFRSRSNSKEASWNKVGLTILS
jgi:hypothetical protein